MTPTELLADLERRNVRIEAVGERIRFGPRHLVTPDLRTAMAEHKCELLALLAMRDPEVGWRADAMRPEVPVRGPIPFLVARWTEFLPGTCMSCGELLQKGRRVRCEPCVIAVECVLTQVREGA